SYSPERLSRNQLVTKHKPLFYRDQSAHLAAPPPFAQPQCRRRSRRTSGGRAAPSQSVQHQLAALFADMLFGRWIAAICVFRRGDNGIIGGIPHVVIHAEQSAGDSVAGACLSAVSINNMGNK